MHYHILGAGSIGSLFGAHLLSTKNKVSLIFRRACQKNLFIDNGSKIEIIKDTKVNTYIGFDAEMNTSKSIYDRLLVTTKANHTLEAIKSVSHNIKDTTTLILLQNGMGTLDELMDYFNTKNIQPKIILGITSHGCYRKQEEPFTIYHAADADATFAAADQSIHPKLKGNPENIDNELWKQLNGLDLNVSTQLDSNIMLENMLMKLALNCCVNPIAALFKVNNGGLLDNELALNLIKQTCNEISQVFNNMKPSIMNDILLDKDKLYDYLLKVIYKVRNNRCSMLQDIENKNQTEIDYINGYIVNKGKELNVKTPVNSLIVELIKQKEKEYLK